MSNEKYFDSEPNEWAFNTGFCRCDRGQPEQGLDRIGPGYHTIFDWAKKITVSFLVHAYFVGSV